MPGSEIKMASARHPVAADFTLTPQQQNLLFAALESNKPSNPPASNGFYPSPSLNGSPDQATDGFGNPRDSLFAEYDYDFGRADSSFDFSVDSLGEASMIGALPDSTNVVKSESTDADVPDKRGHPEDEEEERQGEAKRHESDEKVAKKPGRKPLTTEPTNKRKAQNRAAQRAFRERKEKHLKDLETKVEELQRASESTTQENGLLRAQIEKLTSELNEYKKRLSVVPSLRTAVPSTNMPTFPRNFNGLADINFQFDIPKFGVPGQNTSQADDRKPTANSQSREKGSGPLSPLQTPRDSASPGNSSTYSQIALDQQTKEDLAIFSARLFDPLRNHGNARSMSSLDVHFMGGATTTSSPSASSNSNAGGASSSCGTSPEPLTQSPGPAKPVDTMFTIGEEQIGIGETSAGFGPTSFAGQYSWLPQNFEFEPQLYGDYREPQDNILSNSFDDTLLNDPFDADFVTPYNIPPKVPAAASAPASVPAKKTLIAQIDEARINDELAGDSKTLTCTKIWEHLQNCPKVKNGDFDLDALCSDLQKKARCTGAGAVVNETDFQNVMQKYICKDDKAARVTQKS